MNNNLDVISACQSIDALCKNQDFKRLQIVAQYAVDVLVRNTTSFRLHLPDDMTINKLKKGFNG